MKVSLDTAIRQAERILDHLNDLKANGAEYVESQCNTYGLESPFLALGYDGYVNCESEAADSD